MTHEIMFTGYVSDMDLDWFISERYAICLSILLRGFWYPSPRSNGLRLSNFGFQYD